MSRLRLVVAEAVRSITANISTTVAATLTVLIGMFLVGLLIGFGSYARSWSDQKKGELLVKTFFCVEQTCAGKEATQKQIDSVAADLEDNPLVKSFRFISKEKALEQEQQKHPELYAQLPANPLPDAFEIVPVSGEQTKALAISLRTPKPAGVQKVTFGAETAERILDIARLIEILFLVAVIVLLAASTVLIANTIRLSIFARRREVEIMKLVGASNWFVRGPFMLEGLICGFVGAIFAVILLLIGKEVALPELGWFDDPDVHALAFGLNALILVALGLLLGAAGSAVTLRRFLKV